VAKGKSPQKPSDVASLAMTLYVLLTGKMPFHGQHVETAHDIIFQIGIGKRPELPACEPGSSLDAVNAFLRSMWQGEAAKRPLAKTVHAQFTLWIDRPPSATSLASPSSPSKNTELKEEDEFLTVDEIEAALKAATKARKVKSMKLLGEILKAQLDVDAAYERGDVTEIERCEAILWRLNPVSLGLSAPSGEPPDATPSSPIASPVHCHIFRSTLNLKSVGVTV